MTTFLSKLFKPKWQHKHLPTRIEAIQALDPNNEEQQTILCDIAENDNHEDARAAAVKRLNQSTVLVALHKKASSNTQQVIEQRLYELADAQSLTIYDLIVDLKLLTDMIVKSDNPDAFIRGLGHIEDAQALLTIAQSSKTSKIRQAAAELIESEEQLQSLTQTAKSKDKSVYQIAKNKLNKIKAFQKQQKETQEKLESTLKALEDHANTDNLKLYEPKLTSLLQRWEPLLKEANSDQEQRFDAAYEQCKNKLNALLREQQSQEEQERLIKVGGDEQQATLLTLQDTLDKFRKNAASPRELSALDAIIKTQETRWLEATRHHKVDKSKVKHYQVLMSELRNYLNALKATGEKSEELSELISHINAAKKSDPKQIVDWMSKLKKELSLINWPDQYSPPELLAKAQQAVGKTEDLKAELAKSATEAQQKIQSLIKELDKALEEKQIKQSSQIHKRIQSLLSQVEAAQAAKVHAALSLRVNQLNELRAWQGYASTPRQTELCELMEKLAETHLDPQEKAKRIKAMQKEWKTLGGAAEKQLWDRFKTAADLAFEPCKAFFDEQGRLKEANLERRKTLIEQLKSFIDNTDWTNPDWKLTEQINRKARIEWKEAYPVDFKANKSCQNEFNTLLAKLDAHLENERSRNNDLKAAIVEKAKALIDEENLEKAINEAKSLQQNWKSIGITEHKLDRKQWKDFRKACDQIFERRDQERDTKREENETAIKEFEAFCLELESFNASSEGSTLEQCNAALADFRKRFKQLPSVPKKKQEAFYQRFEEGIKAIKKAISHEESKAYLTELKALQVRAAICRKQYISNNQDDIDSTEQDFNSANTLSSALDSKSRSLWISVKAGAVAKEYIVDENEARNICIRCEITAGIDSPESDKELRMQLQVSRLSEGMSSNKESLSREEQLKSLLEEWYLKVGIDEDSFNALEKRIRQATSHLFG